MCFEYVLQTDEIDKQAVQDTFRDITNPHLKNTAMTVADLLRQEGLQTGLQKGRQEGFQEAHQKNILSILRVRFGIVDESLQQRILSLGNVERLEHLLTIAATCGNLAEFSRQL